MAETLDMSKDLSEFARDLRLHLSSNISNHSTDAARDPSQNDMFWIQPDKLRIHYRDQPFTHHANGYEIYTGWKYFEDGVSQQVSIKMYKQSQRAWKESELLKSFKHDHIIKFIDAGDYNLGPFQSYIVTDHFSQNVEGFVKDCGNDNLKKFKSIFQQLLDGLFYIHWRRVIHGSLHPSNIVICPSGAVKISDFGHASIAPTTIASIGNGYQPPEILLGNRDVETSADVFSLGIVMAFIISKGKHPFGDPNEQCFNIKNKAPPNLSIIPYLDPELVYTRGQVSDLLRIMLLKSPSSRPAADKIAKDALFQDNQSQGWMDIFIFDPVLPIDDRFVASKNYEAHSLTELSFCKGAVIMIQEKPEGIFWKGRHLLSGKILDVPKSFLMPASSLQCQKWFFGRLDVRHAVRLLSRNGNKAGTFLVRENEDSEGNYYLSILENSGTNLCVKHYPINSYQDAKYGLSSTQRFECLDELVRYHQSNVSDYDLKTICPINEILAETSMMIDDVNTPKRLLRNKVKISDGHFGELWKGIWDGQTEVSIKKLNFIVNDFAALHMKTLRHENIIRFHALIPEQPTWIVVELFGVGNLHNYLINRRKCCNSMDFVDMSAQIADGMAYLEKMNFVHGRLCAESVLIDDRRICKIDDYGLEPVSHMRRPLAERFQKNEATNEKFTTKSDVRDFGAVLFEMFTGRDPHSENKTSPPDEFPNDIFDLFLACIEECPTKRPTFNDVKMLLTESYRKLSYNRDLQTDDSSSSEFDSSDDTLLDSGPQTLEIRHDHNSLPVRITNATTAKIIRRSESSTDRTYRVLYDYIAQDGSELNVKTGDKLNLMEHGDDGWSMVRRAGGGDEGLVPTTYIEKVFDYMKMGEIN